MDTAAPWDHHRPCGPSEGTTTEGTTMDVGVWLGNLGLGQYEAEFRDNEIDGAVLPKLTLDDLKDLGVAVVGHRRKIMSAIEELNIASVAGAAAMKPRQT